MLTSIEHTEVRCSVGNNTDNGDTETLVETGRTILGEDFLKAVNETSELSLTTGTDISGESSSSEIERVNEAEGSSTSGTTGSAVTNEEFTWFNLGVVRVEDLLVSILESEVKSLSGEISNNVSEVSSP